MSNEIDEQETNVVGLPELGFERDLKREDDGDWVKLGDVPTSRPALEGHVKRVKVRSRYTSDYKQAELRMQTLALRRKEFNRVEYAMERVPQMTARYCLVDWEILQADGKLLPFSKAAAMNLMTDPRYREFAAFVNEAIALLQGDLDEAKEEDSGKL